MLRTLLIVAAAGLMASAGVARAAFPEGTWELTLAGGSTISTGPHSNNNSESFGGSLGYYVTKEVEVSLRQTWAFAHAINHGPGGSESDVGSTAIAADWNFDFGDWVPFVGANIGVEYGQHAHSIYAWAPEGGVKYFLNSTTFIYAMSAWEVPTIGASPTHSEVVSSVGLGVGLNSK